MLVVILEKKVNKYNTKKIVFYFKKCSDLLWEKIVLVISIYSNGEMPEHFLKQLKISQIQYIGTIIMPIGTSNRDVLQNKLENTSRQEKRQHHKCNHIKPVCIGQHACSKVKQNGH